MNQSLHQYMINRNVLTTELILTAAVMAASRQSAQHVFISWVQAQKKSISVALTLQATVTMTGVKCVRE